MLERILQLLAVKCRHKHTSQPFSAATPTNSSGNWAAVGTPTTHYVVCLDCGRKFQYDWQNMRMMR